MQINYKYIDLNKYKNVYVISDLHGSLDIFDIFLNTVNISQDDLLIIDGDIFEKGPFSLGLIKKIIKISTIINIELVLGNNDTIFNEWGPYYNDEDILRYINSVDNSVLIDMAHELNCCYDTLENIKLLRKLIYDKYIDIIYFLKNSPHILESDKYIFVHAGIEDKPVNEQTYEYLLTAKAYAYNTNSLHKKIIVGHWPSSNYSKDIIDINPFFNNNVISIDGGLSLKNWSQLNYLVINKDGISFSFIDTHQKIEILDDQKESEYYFSLLYPNTRCEIIDQQLSYSKVYLPLLNKELNVLSNQIYEYRGNYYLDDFTNYYMKLNKGVVVSLIQKFENDIMIKHNGVISLYSGRYKYIE